MWAGRLGNKKENFQKLKYQFLDDLKGLLKKYYSLKLKFQCCYYAYYFISKIFNAKGNAWVVKRESTKERLNFENSAKTENFSVWLSILLFSALLFFEMIYIVIYNFK
jgi:hypothetical protein